MNFPRTIKKKELAIMLGYYSPRTGRIYYWKLYRFVFNKSLLQKLKITNKRIRKIRIFDIDATEIILEHLDISLTEIAKIKKYEAIYTLSTL